LANAINRCKSDVHRDIGKLLEHQLVEENGDGCVFVPWSEIEIHLKPTKEAI